MPPVGRRTPRFVKGAARFARSTLLSVASGAPPAAICARELYNDSSHRRNRGPMIQHNDKPQPNRNRRMVRIVTTVIVTLAIVAIAIGAFAPVRHATDSETTNGKAAPTSVPSRTSSPAPSTTISMPQTASPSPTPKTDGTSDRAKRIVEAMSLDERAGQLVMAALQYGNDPATLQAMIQEQHVGNVILMGNWVSGVENVARATQALQRLNASTGLPGLIIATDQEAARSSIFRDRDSMPCPAPRLRVRCHSTGCAQPRGIGPSPSNGPVSP